MKFRKQLSFLLVSVLTLSVLGLLSVPAIAAVELHVGSGETYATVSAALLDADPGDTIIVHAGTYNDAPVINDLLTIYNNPGDMPVFNAPPGGDYALKFSVGDCQLSGMRFNAGNVCAIDASNCVAAVGISDCVIDTTTATGTTQVGILAPQYKGAHILSIAENTFYYDDGVGGTREYAIDLLGSQDNCWSPINIVNNQFVNQGTASNGNAAVRIGGNVAHGNIAGNTFGSALEVYVPKNSGDNIQDLFIGGTESDPDTNANTFKSATSGGVPLSGGILVTGEDTTNAGVLSNMTIGKNVFQGGQFGIRFYSSSSNLLTDANVDAASIHINRNTFLDNAHPYGGVNCSKRWDNTDIDAGFNWWGNISGPTISSNRWGYGDSVSSYVDYRLWSADSNFSEAVVEPEKMKSLMARDGYFTIPATSTASSADYVRTATAVNLTIPMQSGGSNSTVDLPAGTKMTRADGGKIDTDAMKAAYTEPSSLAGTGGRIIQGALEFGLPGICLNFSKAASVTMAVGPDLDGMKLHVLRSASGQSSWSDEGISPNSVVVSNGLCGFEATKASYYAAMSSTWYLAEGTTAWGFSTYISIENPTTDALTAKVTYMPTGADNVSETIPLPASSQTTLTNDHLVQVMGGSMDFSTRIECPEGEPIAVDRTMSWTGEGAASPEGHSSVGVTSPARTWYLPEGSSEWGFECWLLIQNPNNTAAECDVTYMIEGSGPRTVTHEVGANSRASFDISKDIGSKDASIKVESNVPVIPERAMYRNGRREGHESIGTTAPANDYYLAEGTTAWGFTTYVLVQNPHDSATEVTITYMTPSGPKEQPSFRMDGNSRKTIRVNDVPLVSNTDLSTRVHGTQPIIAERAMYWNGGPDSKEACHDSIGMASPHTTFYLPDGQTSEAGETWTLVQNPNDYDVSIEVSYLKAGGGTVTFTDTVPKSSRKTYNMVDKGIDGRSAVLVTSKTTGKKIMVERAMYWNTRGAGTDTIGGYSD